MNLSDHEMAFCKEEMKRLGFNCITDLLREVINDRRRFGPVPETSAISRDIRTALDGVEKRIDELKATFIGRLAKLERIQRTLILNTAYARGYAIGAVRTSPPESRKPIETEMLKNYETQLEFFLNLFPDQREGSSMQAQS